MHNKQCCCDMNVLISLVTSPTLNTVFSMISKARHPYIWTTEHSSEHSSAFLQQFFNHDAAQLNYVYSCKLHCIQKKTSLDRIAVENQSINLNNWPGIFLEFHRPQLDKRHLAWQDAHGKVCCFEKKKNEVLKQQKGKPFNFIYKNDGHLLWIVDSWLVIYHNTYSISSTIQGLDCSLSCSSL